MTTRLFFQKYPKEDGQYNAGNLSPVFNRLEIDLVTVIGEDVFVGGDKKPFIFNDFDYWSDKAE